MYINTVRGSDHKLESRALGPEDMRIPMGIKDMKSGREKEVSKGSKAKLT